MTKRAIVVALCVLAAVIWLGCSDDDDSKCIVDPNNNPPLITSITADPDTILELGITTITVIAEDPDGDSLNYGWHIASPELQRIGGEHNTLLAKSCCDIADTTTCLVLSIVTDGRCGETRDTVSVYILPQ